MPGAARRPVREPVTGPAPGRLELVREFVNTLDVEADTDELGSPAALDAWLAERELAGHELAGHELAGHKLAGHELAGHELAGHGPASGGAAAGARGAGRATADDLGRAVALREALREVLAAHVGHGDPDAVAVADLRSLAAGLPVRLAVGADGAVSPAAAGAGPAAGLAALLVIAAEAATLGTWRRLKVCSADDCRWAFYDRSPTRSGCWCSMAVCGSRAKSRAYRRRAAARA